MERADEVVAARDAAQRQADQRVAAHRDPGGGRVLRVLRRLGRQGDGRDDSGQGQLPHLHAARAARRLRRDRAVELPAAARGVEGRAGARVRQHRHPQAGEPDAADGARARRDRGRGRAAAGRAERPHRPGREARSGDRRASRHRQDRVHRRHQHRQGDHAGRRRHAQEDHARARRQVAEHRARRTPTSKPRFAARRSASSTARARSAPPDRGCWSTSRSRTSSSTSSRRARRRWSPAIRWIPKTRFGALSSKKQLETVLRYVDIGEEGRGDARRRRRARPTSAPARATSSSRRCSPTSTPEMTIAREEIFGPVLAAIEFADVDEAIARANDSPYGLAAGVWTRDIKKAHYVAPKAPGRHGLDQHLQRLRHRRAVRRLQAERLRPRDERARARALHAGQDVSGWI